MKKRILLPLIIVLVLIAGIFCSSDEPVPDDPASNSGTSTEATDSVLPEDTSKNLPPEKNRVYLSSRQEAIDGGYDPCGNCDP